MLTREISRKDTMSANGCQAPFSLHERGADPVKSLFEPCTDSTTKAKSKIKRGQPLLFLVENKSKPIVKAKIEMMCATLTSTKTAVSMRQNSVINLAIE